MSYKTHNSSYTRLYRIFATAKHRCTSPKNKDYPMYGAKGIKFLWLSFEIFKIDMESTYLKAVEKQGAKDVTLDRINNFGPYSTENCRWATRKEQARNRGDNHIISFENKSLTVAEWAQELEINHRTLRTRLLRKMPLEKALRGNIYRKNHE